MESQTKPSASDVSKTSNALTVPALPPAQSFTAAAQSFLDILQDLHRSRYDAKLGGVCGGLGAATPIPAWTWRALLIVSVLSLGIGLLPYLILWVTLPTEPSEALSSESALEFAQTST